VGTVARPAARRPLPPRTRVAAWLVTGPVGHLWAGALDWAALLARVAWARVLRREVRWPEW
jgi:hypothetical protein